METFYHFVFRCQYLVCIFFSLFIFRMGEKIRRKKIDMESGLCYNDGVVKTKHSLKGILMNIHETIASLESAKIVSIRTKTPLKMLAASKLKFPKGVSKISVRNGIVGASYENAVNNQLQRHSEIPDFRAESLWKGKGRRISKFLVEHTETHEQYLSFLPRTINGVNVTKSIYVDNNTGLEIDFSEVSSYMPPYRENSSGVNWQVIKLDNIIGIKCGEIEFSR